MAINLVVDVRPEHYSKMVSRSCRCHGCGLLKWLYSWPEWIDAAVAEFKREHLLCTMDEIDIVTGEKVGV